MAPKCGALLGATELRQLHLQHPTGHVDGRHVRLSALDHVTARLCVPPNVRCYAGSAQGTAVAASSITDH
jgi:hypothetical protein